MNLEDLLKETKSKIIYLIDREGKTIDFFPKDHDLLDSQDKILAFNSIIFNMSNNFFNLLFNDELNEIILKSENETFFLVKHNNDVLCFISEKSINISLLSLTLKNIDN